MVLNNEIQFYIFSIIVFQINTCAIYLSASLTGKLDSLADALCKWFGSRSEPTECQARAEATLFAS